MEWHTPALVPEHRYIRITPRQADILAGICRGHSNEDISHRLFISLNTVKTIVKMLLRDMGADNRAHAAALAASGQVTVLVFDNSTRRKKWQPQH